MTQYLAGKINTEITNDLFSKPEQKAQKQIKFSTAATKVFDAGRELWKYYHASINSPSLSGRAGVGLVNASLYDIREYFQGRNESGKMNNKSEDEKYTELIGNLRNALKVLAKKIEPKVYEYGFLKG